MCWITALHFAIAFMWGLLGTTLKFLLLRHPIGNSETISMLSQISLSGHSSANEICMQKLAFVCLLFVALQAPSRGIFKMCAGMCKQSPLAALHCFYLDAHSNAHSLSQNDKPCISPSLKSRLNTESECMLLVAYAFFLTPSPSFSAGHHFRTCAIHVSYGYITLWL